MAGKGDARSSAELAVKHDSWSKVCGQAARRLRPKVRRWRWTLREGDGQPLRLLVDLTGASLAAATSRRWWRRLMKSTGPARTLRSLGANIGASVQRKLARLPTR